MQEKGLVTYFEDTWVAERDQRRHSIEREIEIKESDLYKNNRPPPLFYGESAGPSLGLCFVLGLTWLPAK